MSALFEGKDKSERREALVELLIELRQRLGENGEGWQHVSDELHRLIEWLFNGSETYELALYLYERRFSLVGQHGPAAVLRAVLDEQLKPSPQGEPASPEDDNSTQQTLDEKQTT